MQTKLFSPGPFKTFYIVFAYILVFAIWWAYLLYEKNETAFNEKIELDEIRYQESGAQGEYKSTEAYAEVLSKYNRQRLMIITEGGVFLGLLLFGLLRVRKVFLDEMKLAAQQQNFLLSVTHELKSPLSTIKLSLQTLAKRRPDAVTSEKLINHSLTDLDRLETLVENILFAAKIERDEPGFSNEPVNLSNLTEMILERFASNKKSITIHADIQPDITARLDVIGFTSVVTNLVENAIKYSASETDVRVSLQREGSYLELIVTDTGIGISDSDKERVFEKFYRVGNENTRNTKGTGLGLYIVKRFIEIYKGEILIEDNQPRGSSFRLRIPV